MVEKKVIKSINYCCWAIFMVLCSSSVFAQPIHRTSNSTIKSNAALSEAQKKLLLDSDGDGLPDSVERELKLNTRARDTNHDGTSDGNSDANHNGIIDVHDFQTGKFDTDNDGLSDADELSLGSDPYNPDSNSDGIKDGQELGMKKPSILKLENEGIDSDEGNEGDDDNSPTLGHKAPAKSKRPIKKKPIPPCKKPRQKNCYKKPLKPIPAPSKPTIAPTPHLPAIPTVKPPSVPTAKPTVSPPGNFDSAGNTTKFGIPLGLTGNVGRGSSIWPSNCSGCHGSEKSNRTFGQIKGSMSIPAMSGIRLGDSQLADLVAYLNRFQK